MRWLMVAGVTVVLLLGAVGCSSQRALVTRTYELPLGDTSWDAITMVLQDEWHHGVISHAQRHENTAAVQTSARGHRKIEAALARR